MERRPPRLVLLYATCSLARASISPYSEGLPYTPHLEAFAADSLVFDRHHTESGQSGVAYASLFTGTQQAHHGVFSHPSMLPDHNLTLAERFAGGSYETHSWLRHSMANASLGYAQGVAPPNRHPDILRADDPDFVALLERLAVDPGAKAFVMTNFSVTHGPYRGAELEAFCGKFPGRCGARSDSRAFRADRKFYRKHHLALSFDFDASRARFGIDNDRRKKLGAMTRLLYEADVHRLDAMFGAVLDRIERAGLADESLVVFTADHGEIADRANAPFKWTHGFQQAPEVLNVPLIVRGRSAGIEPGRYAAVTRSIDVASTIEGLAMIAPRGSVSDAPADPRFSGSDLSASIRGDTDPPALLAYMHTALFSPRVWEDYRHLDALVSRFPEPGPEHLWASMRDGDRWWTLRRPPGGSFAVSHYDLATDPGLSRDLFDAGDPEHAAVAERLRRYKGELVVHAKGRERVRALSREDETERLRALGYIE